LSDGNEDDWFSLRGYKWVCRLNVTRFREEDWNITVWSLLKLEICQTRDMDSSLIQNLAQSSALLVCRITNGTEVAVETPISFERKFYIF